MTDVADRIEESGAIKRGRFKLSDGSLTDYYVDKYSFETRPAVLSDVVDALVARLPDEIDCIAGPALGAIPLVTAVSLRTGIPSAYIRMGDTYRGTQARVEGSIEKGQRVAVLEDVTTTGGTILESADIVEEMGGTIETMLVVVDRNEGAVANVADAGYELDYLVQVGTDLDVE